MHIKPYQQARKYLESFIRPMAFRQITLPDGSETDPLERMRILLDLLGNPHESFKSVLVSGSAGKGSTAYLLSHILTTAGYKTGLSISPHLEKITERMQINSIHCTDEEFVELVNRISPVVEKMRHMPVGEPSYFELLLALAFLHFKDKNIDIAVVEVGIEGKFDATHVLSPNIVVLSNIYLDHMEILGDTEEEIAKEAVSIIKTDKQIVITGVHQPSVLKIIEEKARSIGSELKLLGKDFTYTTEQVTKHSSIFDFRNSDSFLPGITLSLIGSYQIENASLAIEAVYWVENKYGISVLPVHIETALKTASFAGRFETISYQQHEIILDGAHNPAKMEAFLESLKRMYSRKRKVFIVAFKKGKQIEKMLQEIYTIADEIILTEFHRTIDTEKNASVKSSELDSLYQSALQSKKIPITAYASAPSALSEVLTRTSREDLIIVTGSLYLVGEIREYIHRR